MSARDAVMILSTISLVFVGIYYGVKFNAIKNYLLGWEWIVIGFSASNMLLAIVTGIAFFEEVAYFCDSFSRSFGFPLIATLGFVELFRGRKFPVSFDIALFAAGAVFAAAARTVWAEAPALQVSYIFLGGLFNVCMLYFAMKLFSARLRVHGFAVLATVVALLLVSLLEGGYLAFPGEETNVLFNWLTVAELVWAMSFAEYYYAYRALAQSMGELEVGDEFRGRKGHIASA